MTSHEVSTALQQSFWNGWNAAHREASLADVSEDQRAVVLRWLDATARRDLRIIDVGCGTGWLSGRLAHYGHVTATDLADAVVARAAERHPEVSFRAGDFMSLDFPERAFDVAVSCEVLSHVADQQAFVARIARLLKPGGLLMVATQNRPALQLNDIPPPAPGQLRRWVDRRELAVLLGRDFEVEEMFSITPRFNRGALRRLNSPRLRSAAESAGLGRAMPWLRRLQERAGLGWTLMARARRR